MEDLFGASDLAQPLAVFTAAGQVGGSLAEPTTVEAAGTSFDDSTAELTEPPTKRRKIVKAAATWRI